METKRTPNARGIAGPACNLLLTVLSLLAYRYVHIHYYHLATFHTKGNYLMWLLYGTMLALLLSVYGAYRIQQSRTRELVFSYAMGSTITNAVTYAIMCLVAEQMLSAWAMVVMTLLQWVMAMGIYALCRILVSLVEPAIPTIYIHCDNDWDNSIPEKFDHRRTIYTVTARVDGAASVPELEKAMEPYPAVLLGDMPAETRHWVLAYCYRTGRYALMVPDVSDILLGSARAVMMGDSLLYDLNTQEESLGYRMGKRALDILVSAVGLIVLSPVMLLTALAVKLCDGGPVFYRQLRLTRGGREFYLTKFRSMIVDAEKKTGAVLAEKEDDRITPVGKLIRAARIDELPQLWTILKGDMTLVGPRPERPEFYAKICEEFPEFEYRLKVKAGLTGYAQLYGKYNTTFADKVRMDVYYIQHMSFLHDLRLLFYTLKILFVRESTEGVADQNLVPSEKEASKH